MLFLKYLEIKCIRAPQRYRINSIYHYILMAQTIIEAESSQVEIQEL